MQDFSICENGVLWKGVLVVETKNVDLISAFFSHLMEWHNGDGDGEVLAVRSLSPYRNFYALFTRLEGEKQGNPFWQGVAFSPEAKEHTVFLFPEEDEDLEKHFQDAIDFALEED